MPYMKKSSAVWAGALWRALLYFLLHAAPNFRF